MPARTGLRGQVAGAKAEIASQLTLAPAHFSRILHELAQAALLQVQGRRIPVPDRQRLQAATPRR